MTGSSARFRGEPVPATGFSIGVSRLLAALKTLGKLDASDAERRPGRRAGHGPRPSLADYQRMVAELREAGIRAELYLGALRHEGADEICRPPRRALRRHPGLRRAREGEVRSRT